MPIPFAFFWGVGVLPPRRMTVRPLQRTLMFLDVAGQSLYLIIYICKGWF